MPSAILRRVLVWTGALAFVSDRTIGSLTYPTAARLRLFAHSKSCSEVAESKKGREGRKTQDQRNELKVSWTSADYA